MNSFHDAARKVDASKIDACSTTRAILDAVEDGVRSMMEQERNAYCYQNYARWNSGAVGGGAGGGRIAPSVDSEWREKICEWAMGLADYFELSRETVAVGLALLDRYLATLDLSQADQGGDEHEESIASGTMLLAAVTTMHVAIKVHDYRKIRLSFMCKLSRGLFSPEDVERMELTVLRALGWHVHPPTSVSFVSYLLQLLLLLPSEGGVMCFQGPRNLKDDLYATARYLAELSVCDGRFVDRHPSDVALASVLLALDVHRADCAAASFTSADRARFERSLAERFGLRSDSLQVAQAYEILRETYFEAMGYPPQQQEQARDQAMAPVAPVPVEESPPPAIVSPIASSSADGIEVTEFSLRNGSPSTVIIGSSSSQQEVAIQSSKKRSRTYETSSSSDPQVSHYRASLQY